MNYYLSSPDSSSSDSYYESSLSFGSRPESTTPTLTQAYPAFAKLRQEACRGFEAEDDNEFCPALVVSTPLAAPVAASMTPLQGVHPINLSSHMPLTQPQESDLDSVPTVAVRARKALEIIDPATGMPVGRR